MANWCNNTVTFDGTPKAIELIRQLFKSMVKKQEKEECGQLPDFISEKYGGHFFNIYQEYEDSDTFQYETKWSPNTDVLKSIAERYKVNFTQDFEELANLVFGKALFYNETLTIAKLKHEDFEKYEYDQEQDIYYFESKEYNVEYDILEILLERKLENDEKN